MPLLDTLKTIAVALILIVVGLSWVAKYFPGVAWIQKFRLPEVHRTEAQKLRRQRAANRLAAFEMMIFSLAFPGIYLLSRVMMFEEPKLGPLLLWSSGTVICWIVAITILVRNSRKADDERLADFINRG